VIKSLGKTETSVFPLSEPVSPVEGKRVESSRVESSRVESGPKRAKVLVLVQKAMVGEVANLSNTLNLFFQYCQVPLGWKGEEIQTRAKRGGGNRPTSSSEKIVLKAIEPAIRLAPHPTARASGLNERWPRKRVVEVENGAWLRRPLVLFFLLEFERNTALYMDLPGGQLVSWKTQEVQGDATSLRHPHFATYVDDALKQVCLRLQIAMAGK